MRMLDVWRTDLVLPGCCVADFLRVAFRCIQTLFEKGFADLVNPNLTHLHPKLTQFMIAFCFGDVCCTVEIIAMSVQYF